MAGITESALKCDYCGTYSKPFARSDRPQYGGAMDYSPQDDGWVYDYERLPKHYLWHGWHNDPSVTGLIKHFCCIEHQVKYARNELNASIGYRVREGQRVRIAGTRICGVVIKTEKAEPPLAQGEAKVWVTSIPEATPDGRPRTWRGATALLEAWRS